MTGALHWTLGLSDKLTGKLSPTIRQRFEEADAAYEAARAVGQLRTKVPIPANASPRLREALEDYNRGCKLIPWEDYRRERESRCRTCPPQRGRCEVAS